jgi:hypothetical protein
VRNLRDGGAWSLLLAVFGEDAKATPSAWPVRGPYQRVPAIPEVLAQPPATTIARSGARPK